VACFHHPVRTQITQKESQEKGLGCGVLRGDTQEVASKGGREECNPKLSTEPGGGPKRRNEGVHLTGGNRVLPHEGGEATKR